MALQITYKGFCALGALNNPRLFTRVEYLVDRYYQTTYWMVV